MTDTATATDHQSAMFKIKSVLRTTEKDMLDHIDNRIEIVQGRRPRPELMAVNPLQTVLQAIAEQKIIDLDYMAYATANQSLYRANRRFLPGSLLASDCVLSVTAGLPRFPDGPHECHQNWH